MAMRVGVLAAKEALLAQNQGGWGGRWASEALVAVVAAAREPGEPEAVWRRELLVTRECSSRTSTSCDREDPGEAPATAPCHRPLVATLVTSAT